MKIQTPTIPFPNYKWRWAVYTPTESLNAPPVFLGILRVLADCENLRFRSDEVNEGLRIVQEETDSTVNLVRSKDRNIFRNSGQYWKALGVLDKERRGYISLTQFGKKLALREITQVEFACTIVKTLELPNRRIETNTSSWDNANLKIKPLELILDIISALYKCYGQDSSYLTPDELVKIVIPLAGEKSAVITHTEAIIFYRQGTLDISSWPNCAESLNDKRMAREFLIFLSNYGLCERVKGVNNLTDKYFLQSISIEEINELKIISVTDLDNTVKQLRSSQITANIERKRIAREVWERPYQEVFRKNVLNAFDSKCIMTGVTLKSVLEAAHIKPVKYSGVDEVSNGLCLRSDIHSLFDANHLRITLSGKIILSEEAHSKINYGSLTNQIIIPSFINQSNLNWRIKYY